MSYIGVQNWKMFNGRTDLPHNYIYPGNPPTDVNPPVRNMTWLNSVTGVIFTCIDNTPNANKWYGTRAFEGATPLAFSYDGVDDYSDTGYFPTGGQSYTWIMKLRCHSGTEFASGCHDNSNHRFYLGISNLDTTPTIYAAVGTGYDVSTTLSYSPGEWVYLTMTYDTSTAKVYINDTLLTSFSASFSGTSSLSMLIGARHYSGEDRFGDLDIEKIILRSDVLSGTEIAEIVTNDRYDGDGSLNHVFLFDAPFGGETDLSQNANQLVHYNGAALMEAA